MANTLLNSSVITAEALRILHGKLNFVSTINRQYDSSFAQSGAKIGDTLKIRLPNQYTVRTGANLVTQDTVESSTTLQVATQKGVDVNFTSVDLTLRLDDFSDRILKPAMSKLAAAIEADAMTMYKDVAQSVWNGGGANSLAKVAAGRAILQRALVDPDDRYANLNVQDMQDIVTGGATLFNDSKEISRQYKEGFVGRQGGFDYLENPLWDGARHTRGTAASYVCNTSTGITSGSGTITLTGGTGNFLQGDVFEIEGVVSVNENGQATNIPMQFVATATGTTSVSVYPVPVTSGANQNVAIVGAGAGKVVNVKGTANTSVGTSLLYHKDAFTFATADLVMPKNVHFGAREVFDGISMRIVQNYDINSDSMPCRIDVLYGFKTIRPQLAVRLHNN